MEGEKENVIHFGGSGLTLRHLEMIVDKLRADGEVTIRGVARGSASLFDLFAEYAAQIKAASEAK
jgi:hypothetical protein